MKKQITLFERAVGEQGVRDLLRSFYDRVLNDSELAPFFENASIEGLFAMQHEFFARLSMGRSSTQDFRFIRRTSVVGSRKNILHGRLARAQF